MLISTLRAAPFNIPWGASIYIKVLATNVLGSSEYVEGNGAILVTIPDAPINLADMTLVTSHTQVGLSWEDGYSDGGSAILDYRIFSSTDDLNFGVVNFGIVDQSYTITSLVAGTTYYFRVQARNIEGYGY